MYLTQPCWNEDGSALSRAIYHYRNTARTAICQNTPVEDIIGPPEIDVSVFLKNQDSKEYKERFPRVDRWLSLINNTLDDTDVIVRLGCIYLQWHLMRASTISQQANALSFLHVSAHPMPRKMREVVQR